MRPSDITRYQPILEALKDGRIYHTPGDPRFLVRAKKDFIVWKKVFKAYGDYSKKVIRLTIPADTRISVGYRSSYIHGAKCRAEKAVALDHGYSTYALRRGVNFPYIPGEEVVPTTDFAVVAEPCSAGIHFFFTEQEAKEYCA
jgi:hypothetical protein